MERIVFFLKNRFSEQDEAELSEYFARFGVKAEYEGPKFKPVYSDYKTLLCTDDPDIYRQVKEAGEDALIFIEKPEETSLFPGGEYFLMDPLDAEFDYFDKIWRRIRDIPWEILRTEHLIIRETVESDVDSFAAIYADPGMTDYTDPLYNVDDEKKYVRDYRRRVYAVQGFGIWTVLSKETGEVIGRAGLTVRAGFDDIETGFVIGRKWQNKGYATEAVQAVTDIGHKMGFERVIALVMPGNAPSFRVLEKCGYSHGGRVKLDKEYETMFHSEFVQN